ncbi:Protein chibby 1 [Halocaridina rubra]|uniref:Protein chibby 1 n=1 Tax=Halocaridina rubra TaxID=373956 RepID=A0AAN8WLT7_HALRR
MPINLFGRSFSPGPSPPRRAVSLSSLRRESDKSGVDLSNNFSKIRLNIGGQNASFEDGEWIADEGSRGRVSSREVAKLRQQNQNLQEENNLLKLKVELLLDMLTEKSADALIKDKEITRLKSKTRGR